jgi:hypothetical protein
MFKIPGFHFHETMQGTYTRDGVERPVKFMLEARAGSWLQHLRDGKARISGTIDADGLASGRPIAGEMIIDMIVRRIIKYDFRFDGDDGKPYRFAGQKDISYLDFVNSMTTLPAEILDGGGRAIARALLAFDRREIPAFFKGWRLDL